jgi:hypothetical protein
MRLLVAAEFSHPAADYHEYDLLKHVAGPASRSPQTPLRGYSAGGEHLDDDRRAGRPLRELGELLPLCLELLQRHTTGGDQVKKTSGEDRRVPKGVGCSLENRRPAWRRVGRGGGARLG